uniref:Uncharacterized protein n=1 Tax=Aegilops tauschii TaxID=37682 RepID=M8BFG8_AEGTA|nr:uncharacterized protein LOC109783563 [Aegilops tauschii subsp. strangulata]
MDIVVCISFAILALVLTGPYTKAAALADGTTTIDAAAAVSQTMSMSSSLMKDVDGVAPELAAVDSVVHRRVLAQGNVGPSPSLDPNRAICNKACTGGKPYNLQHRP